MSVYYWPLDFVGREAEISRKGREALLAKIKAQKAQREQLRDERQDDRED